MDFALILRLLNFLPSIIQLVEIIHPPSATGAQKLETAVKMVQLAIPAAAGATAASAAAGQSNIEQLISGVVAGMNAAGVMPQSESLGA